MRIVVATNVAVVANGKSAQASPACTAECSLRLNEITRHGKLILDDKRLILKEYMQNLRSAGQPGVGDAFLKWVLTNYGNPDRCELVAIHPKNQDCADFAEFPATLGLSGFHEDDRKFVAVAMAHPGRPPILQAVDTEWRILRDQLQAAGVTIDFLCQDNMRIIAERSARS